MNKVYEFYKDGLYKTIVIKEHMYDMIEFTILQRLTDDDDNVLIDSKYDQYFTNKEFKEFFSPIVNDLKERFDGVPSGVEK
jgi:hypothetical protein